MIITILSAILLILVVARSEPKAMGISVPKPFKLKE